ncbi:GNAT family N-acetyltransferase [Corynebacterium liangguodongii]|uniref:N-acetyltransferase n=1 Tax=Corynebacterium liangguodongii TaxID=2079535 RepID=A0A2S0WDC1_9CORY|nr:GNAT family N-acetyltransferase [Corynebacterium liangguodongii]AWB83761.1 N-acetyltransferase [Corynebacterium liangguodongii]PWB99429.1 N-acetyltransferase [Corynebacterium liangguodongii]
MRIAKLRDAASAARLLREFNVEFGCAAPDLDALTRRYEKLISSGAGFVVLADGFQGFAQVTLRPTPYSDGPLAVLDELYVVPEHRSRGIGSRLLSRVETELRERGCEEMHISVDAGDVDARRFYERHGYSKTDPETGKDMYLYVREFGRGA